MINPDQVLSYNLDRAALSLIYQDAKLACLGGKSHVRGAEERKTNLVVDQMVGLIGNYVGAVWRDGDT